MLELILAAVGAAGVIGFFLGRRGGAPSEHQSVIASLAVLSRDERTKVLNMPSVSSASLPQVLEATGAALPSLPLFTDAEKTALLNEVADYQKSRQAQGTLFSQSQWVTPDEIALKPPLLPTTVMAGSERYRVINLRA